MVESLQRAADAVDLVGVDALADVALDREAGQVDVVLPPAAASLP